MNRGLLSVPQKSMIADYANQLSSDLSDYSVDIGVKFLRNLRSRLTNIYPKYARDAIIELRTPKVKPTAKGSGCFASLLLQPENSDLPEGFRAIGRFFFKHDFPEIGMLFEKYHPNTPFEPVLSRMLGKEEPDILEGDERGSICYGDLNTSYLNVNYDAHVLGELPFAEDVMEVLRVSITPVTDDEVERIRNMSAEDFQRSLEEIT